MKIVFEGKTFADVLKQVIGFIEDQHDYTIVQGELEDKISNVTPTKTPVVSVSKPKKKKAAKPEPVEEVKETPAEEPEPEKDDEMDIEDMREAMRQDMMAIYTNPDGKKFVEDKLSEYSLKNFSELPEDKVEEVFTSVREFRQELAA